MDGSHNELMKIEEDYRNLYRLDMPEL